MPTKIVESFDYNDVSDRLNHFQFVFLKIGAMGKIMSRKLLKVLKTIENIASVEHVNNVNHINHLKHVNPGDTDLCG